MEGLGACSPTAGRLGRCPPPPGALLPPSSPSPWHTPLLCSLFGSCLNCVIFVDECELLNPERSAGNTNSPASWHSPPGVGARPTKLVALSPRGISLEENADSQHRPRSVAKGREEAPRRGWRQDALHRCLGMSGACLRQLIFCLLILI